MPDQKQPQTSDPTPQCTSCGACCFSDMPDYIRVMGIDYDRLGEHAQQYVHFIGNRAFMRMSDGHCSALRNVAGQFICEVYEQRPDVCRSLQRGSGMCGAERHEKHDRTLVMLRRSRNQG